MTIERHLLGANFGPRTIEVIAEAYDGVVKALGLVSDASLERAASIMLDLAKDRDILDPDRLREDTITVLKSRS